MPTFQVAGCAFGVLPRAWLASEGLRLPDRYRGRLPRPTRGFASYTGLVGESECTPGAINIPRYSVPKSYLRSFWCLVVVWSVAHRGRELARSGPGHLYLEGSRFFARPPSDHGLSDCMQRTPRMDNSIERQAVLEGNFGASVVALEYPQRSVERLVQMHQAPGSARARVGG